MADGAPLSGIRTTCPYCGVGCGVVATPTGEDSATVEGDIQHPSNFGRLCSKGAALGETLGRQGRLLAPVVDGKRANWDTAMARVADGFAAAIRDHGPDSVAFYLSGQLLTEDYYVANKLMKGFIGSANVDTNSRLCMASAVAGYKRAFGADTVPCTYNDLENCDLLVLVGSNLAWCHPVLYQRISAARESNPAFKLIVIDPRRTASCELADLHLPLAPGSDVALFQGLFRALDVAGVAETGFISQHTNGIDAARASASSYTVDRVAAETGLAAEDIAEFYTAVTATPRTVTVYSMGVNQATDGTDKANAIINTHLLTGRIGKEGAGPFSMTGQPNAMGGREVGGLANQLACHMDFSDDDRDVVGRFWRAPNLAKGPGRKAVDMFDAVERGEIKAIWIMATNPVVSMPDAQRVRAALNACPLVVVSEIVPNSDTAQVADVLLPATGWAEKDGTVTNSERRISRQRGFLPAPGLARHDWWAICELARRLGYGEAFDFPNAAAIFREYAAMTAFENNGARDLDLGGLALLDDTAFDALAPVQWPVHKPVRQGEKPTRLFADGAFYTEDKRARFIAPRGEERQAAPEPLTLNTGRIRDQWHTMTRTGRAARLNRHISEPFVELHPDDAHAAGVGDADLVQLSNNRGEIVVRAVLTDRQQRGAVFVPMHWTDDRAAKARVDTLVAPNVDPVSGQPALKSSAVNAARFDVAYYGFAAGGRLALPEAEYWARAEIERGLRMELAGKTQPPCWDAFARTLLGVDEAAELVSSSFSDGASYRCAAFERGRLIGVLFVGARPVAVSREWLCDQVGRIVPTKDRIALLAGRPGEGVQDPGPIVCACMGVGRNTICAAIDKGAASVTQIGEKTGAGTNCGSCRSEIRKLMEGADVSAEA